jgi:hypothetical protein
MGNNLCGGEEREKNSRGKNIKEQQKQTKVLLDDLSKIRIKRKKKLNEIPQWLNESINYLKKHIEEASSYVDAHKDTDAICEFHFVIERVTNDLKIQNVTDHRSVAYKTLITFKARSFASIGYIFEQQLKWKPALNQYTLGYEAVETIENKSNNHFMLLGRIAKSIGKFYWHHYLVDHELENKTNAEEFVNKSEDWLNKLDRKKEYNKDETENALDALGELRNLLKTH